MSNLAGIEATISTLEAEVAALKAEAAVLRGALHATEERARHVATMLIEERQLAAERLDEERRVW